MSIFGKKKHPGLAAVIESGATATASASTTPPATVATGVAANYADRTRELASQADSAQSVDELRSIVKSLGEVHAEGLEEIAKALPSPEMEEVEGEGGEDLDGEGEGDFDPDADEPAVDEPAARALSKGNAGAGAGAESAFVGEAVDATPVLEELSHQLAESNARGDRLEGMLTKSLGVIEQNQATMESVAEMLAAQGIQQGEIAKSMDAMGMRARGTVNGHAAVSPERMISKGMAPGATDALNAVDVEPGEALGRTIPQIAKSLHAHFMAGHESQSGLDQGVLARLNSLSAAEVAKVNEVVDNELAGKYSAPASPEA